MMKYLIAALVMATLAGCTTKNKEQVTIDIEMINDWVLSKGDSISLMAQKALSSHLKKSLGEGGVSNAIKFCNVAAYPILDTLTTGYDVTIRRTTLKLRNPENAAVPLERTILEEFKRLMQNGSELQPVVREIDEHSILFAKPILLNNPLCLNCHGSVGAEVTDEAYALIHQLYPEDSAINYQMEELRGIWSITFNKEAVIAYLETQEPGS
jgi:hypothetical protein